MSAAVDRSPTKTPFPDTRWTMVLAMRHGGCPEAAYRALAELCGIYWRPLYAFARKAGHQPHDAEDLTQSFLADVLERNILATADAERGRLRHLLLACFNNHINNALRVKGAKKRGGGQLHLSLDSLRELESESAFDAQSKDSPQSVYERQCAMELVQRAMTALRDEQVALGRRDLFDQLSGELHQPGMTEGRQEALADRVGLKPGTLRQTLHRLRRRFREILRDQVRETLNQPSEQAIDEELAALRAALEG